MYSRLIFAKNSNGDSSYKTRCKTSSTKAKLRADDDSAVMLQYACNVSIKDHSPVFRDRMTDAKKLNQLPKN